MVISMDIFLELVNNRWIFLSYFFVVFILLTVECKEILCFYFFADKPKSFKKKYKKTHNFLYRAFFGFVFNNEYMQISRYYKYIVRFYIAYLVPVVTYFSLIIFSCFIDTSDQRQTDIFGLLMILLFLITAAYDIWYIAHSEKEKGFCWFLPTTWRRSHFRMKLPDGQKREKLKKKGKKL